MKHHQIIHPIDKLRSKMAFQFPEHNFLLLCQLTGPGSEVFSSRGDGTPEFCISFSLPRLEVMMMMVFLKSTVLPWESVSLPLQDLQKQVEDVVMCFFDFIKEDDAVGFASDRFRQLSPSSKPTYPGAPRSDGKQHVFPCIPTYRSGSCSARRQTEFCRGSGEFGLADPGGSEKDETAHRPVGVIDPGSGTDH